TVWVPDASRAVGVCSSLMSEDLRDGFIEKVKAEQEKNRAQHRNKKGPSKLMTFEAAQANAFKIDWTSYTPPEPNFLGLRTLNNYPLDVLATYIDWTPFFQAWELRGRYPAILEDEVVGEAATNLFKDAQIMLKKIIEQKWLSANAVIGLFPANTVNGDDIEIYADRSRSKVLMTWHSLRQQTAK